MSILTGDADRYAQPCDAEALRAAAPHARLALIRGAWHEPVQAVDPVHFGAELDAWLLRCKAAQCPTLGLGVVELLHDGGGHGAAAVPG